MIKAWTLKDADYLSWMTAKELIAYCKERNCSEWVNGVNVQSKVLDIDTVTMIYRRSGGKFPAPFVSSGLEQQIVKYMGNIK